VYRNIHIFFHWWTRKMCLMEDDQKIFASKNSDFAAFIPVLGLSPYYVFLRWASTYVDSNHSISESQSNDWYRGTTELVQHFRLQSEFTSALLDINFRRLCYIDRLSQWGGGMYFTRSNNFYLPSLRLEEGGGGDRHHVIWIKILYIHLNTDLKHPNITYCTFEFLSCHNHIFWDTVDHSIVKRLWTHRNKNSK
jgi:hypothetical protein